MDSKKASTAIAKLEKSPDIDVRPVQYPFAANFSMSTHPAMILPDGRSISANAIHQDIAENAGFNDVGKFLSKKSM